MSNLSVENLVKKYSDVTAVDHISMEIEEGEFFSLLGPSGCGKSTTLRMLAGFEEVTSGKISIDGEDVSILPPEKRGIGFVFQNYAIFPHMNVFENIAFGLRLRKYSESDIKTKVESALEQVGMSGLETRMQSEMSGGQQQRVALARVLVTEPKILLLDEPLSALDKNLREEMKFWIKDLQTSLGITTIYVTHDQGEALTMSDRIAVMRDGKIAQIGSPKEIYELPSNQFVAEFIGESSILTGKVSSVESSQCRVEMEGDILKVPNNSSLATGDFAQLILRPEHILIGSAPETGDWNEIEAKVKSVIYQGATLRFVFDYRDQNIICEMANLPGAPELKKGQDVKLSWRIESARALPKEHS